MLAHCADRRDVAGQMALFTPDTHFVVYMNAKSAIPSQELHGRESLAPVFENLNNYEVTMHFNGQSTVQLDGSRATGVSYCLAHHLFLRKMESRVSWSLRSVISTHLLSKKADGILLRENSWLIGLRRDHWRCSPVEHEGCGCWLR